MFGQRQRAGGRERVIEDWEQELAQLERTPWASPRHSRSLDDPLSSDDCLLPLGCCECTGHDIAFDSARPFVTGRTAERVERMARTARIATASPHTTARQPTRDAEERTILTARAQKRLAVQAERRTMASPAVSPSSTPEMTHKKRARTPWDEGAPVATRPRSPNPVVQTGIHG